MNAVVVSQPMFFPWIGIFEQLALSDIFVHYDDVQLPQGRSFINRVRVKGSNGQIWLTVPLNRNGKQNINQVRIDYSQPWQNKHLRTLQHCYSKAPFYLETVSIVEQIYSFHDEFLAQLNIRSIEAFAQYFGLKTRYRQSSTLKSYGSASKRLIQLTAQNKGDIYITGHGARNYLDHPLFEKEDIKVQYMDYECSKYPQLHGAFESHLSIIDLAAHMGAKGVQHIRSKTKPWSQFLNG